MKKQQTIPTFIIEEHHEAFIVWNYAIQKGWMPAIGNCLFHVDEHSDMSTPRFNESIHKLNGDIEKVTEFTYKELNIASFIMPACYREIFNQVYWIRQKHRKTLHKPVEMFVRSYNQAGKRILSGKMKQITNNNPDTDRKSFDYFLRHIDQIPSNRKVVLDIDLDYFSCSGNPNESKEIYIEITEAEHNLFIQNKYHRLRYCLNRIEPLKKNDKYYYVINNYNEVYPNTVRVSEEIIKEHILVFIEILKDKNITPYIIDICRSKYSGYTPSSQWEYIEENLLSGLKSLYDLKMENFL